MRFSSSISYSLIKPIAYLVYVYCTVLCCQRRSIFLHLLATSNNVTNRNRVTATEREFYSFKSRNWKKNTSGNERTREDRKTHNRYKSIPSSTYTLMPKLLVYRFFENISKLSGVFLMAKYVYSQSQKKNSFKFPRKKNLPYFQNREKSPECH